MTLDDLRAELLAAVAFLVAPIRGLEDLQRVSLSPGSLAAVTLALKAHTRRHDLIQTVLNALDDVASGMDRLVVDGYPAVPKLSVLADVYRELQEQRADIEVAIGEFEQEPVAAAMTIALGEPTLKME